MKKILFLILLLTAIVFLGSPGRPTGFQSSPASPASTVLGTLTAASTGCATTNSCVAIHQFNSVGASTTNEAVTLSGTWAGTVQFEGSADNGSTWQAISGSPLPSGSSVTSATANGTWIFSTASLTDVRVRCSAFTSGAISIVIQGSTPATTIINLNGSSIASVSVNGLSSQTSIGLARVTNGSSATDCTVGGGTTVVLCLYNGTTWAAIAGGGGSGTITNQVLNQLSLGGSSASAISGTIANGLTGQVLSATNGAAPSFSSPGLPWGNGDAEVTTTPYNVPCDSGTSVAAGDRGKTTLFGSGASVINLPDPTAAGCTGNFAVSFYDDNAGALTVNRGGASTLIVLDGATATDSATSFPLATGNFVLCNAKADGTIVVCAKKTGGSGVSESVWAWDEGTAQSFTTLNTIFDETIFPNAHTITRFVYFDSTPPASCTTAPVVSVVDITGSTTLTSLTLNETGATVIVDSGVLSVATTAGHTIGLKVTTAGATCTQAGNQGFSVWFK